MRWITENSVEERLLRLQAAKQESIDAGMEKVKYNSGRYVLCVS